MLQAVAAVHTSPEEGAGWAYRQNSLAPPALLRSLAVEDIHQSASNIASSHNLVNVQGTLLGAQSEARIEDICKGFETSSNSEFEPLARAFSLEDRPVVPVSESIRASLQTAVDSREGGLGMDKNKKQRAESAERLDADVERSFLWQMLPDPEDASTQSYVRDLKADACEGTGQWITQNSSYQSWYNYPQPQILMVVGPAGQGKSVLAKNIASKLRNNDKSSVVLEAYCQDLTLYDPYLYIVKSILF